MVKNSEIKLFFSWYFLEVPNFFVLIYRGFQKKIWYYFNIIFLLKTIFEPWKRDLVVPVNPSITYRLQAFVENIISRFFGLFIRLVAILVALVLIAILNIVSVTIIIFWYLLMVLFVFSFIKGVLGLIKI